MRLPETALD